VALTFSFPFVGTPAFYTGASTTPLVPDVFPVAIAGRPYMIDLRSNQFTRGFEPRVRDSVDQSTAPGEAAINPGGLWRRGEVSWHQGAGQKYADTAEAQDYRFFRSKGVDPWVKGQLTLLNDTKVSLSTSATNLYMVTVRASNGTEYVYVADGSTLKYTTDPFDVKKAAITNVSASGGTVTYTTSSAHGFTAGRTVTISGVDPSAYNLSNVTIASTPTATSFTVTNAATGTYVSGGSVTQYPVWTSVTTGAPAGSPAITGLETNGVNVYIAYTNNDIYYTTPGSSSVSLFFPTSGTTGQTYTGFGYAKGWGIASVDNKLYVIGIGSGSHTVHYTHPDTTFRWVGAAGGQNAVYAAGSAGEKSIIYKMTLKSDASGLDQPIAALELPLGELATSIHGYLGAILLGTNKGVRYCSTDANNNLVAGALIPTSGPVYDFISEDRFVWFGWSAYDSTSTGLGRLDLSSFIAANTPAHASDVMYGSSTAVVRSVTELNSKRIFTVSGVGVIVEDSANLVASGEIETGIYRWGIPDPKFVARVDTRALPLTGAIVSYMALDGADFDELGVWDATADVENSFAGSDDRAIEARFKFALNRESALVGPTLTRWTARAYAAPFRSEVFRIPILLHSNIRVWDKDYFFDVDNELLFLRGLIQAPTIVTLQYRNETISTIMEDLEFSPVDGKDREWLWEGTAVVTMRSVQE
jgi:hypothetical protein